MWQREKFHSSNAEHTVRAIINDLHSLLAASFLAGRSWQGLEPKLGETPVVKAVEGRRGIAIAYEEEVKTA